MLNMHYISILMLVVANLVNTKWCKKPEKYLKPWHMGTHLRVLMNTNMTRFRWFSYILHSYALDKSDLSIRRVNLLVILKPYCISKQDSRFKGEIKHVILRLYNRNSPGNDPRCTLPLWIVFSVIEYYLSRCKGSDYLSRTGVQSDR